jgi:hypothetical protein
VIGRIPLPPLGGSPLRPSPVGTNWEKYREDFRGLTHRLVRILEKFVKIESITFEEAMEADWQEATITYFNPKTQSLQKLQFHASADYLPPTIELMLGKMFQALSDVVGVDWWCYRGVASNRIIIHNNFMRYLDIKIEVLKVPSDWENIDKLILVKAFKKLDRRDQLEVLYEGEISVFEIFDLVLAVFSLSQI